MPIEPTTGNCAHLLRRAAFGGRPSEVAAVRRDGIETTVDRMLAFQPENDAAPPAIGDPTMGDWEQVVALTQWWYDRMALGPNPLREKLTLFWHHHFATSQDKVDNSQYMFWQNDLFRRRASGKFDDLVLDVARDPAMLVWLDSNDNKKAKPNENFARELMELFTMGVNNGYTQDDVVAAARAFTGWFLNKTTGQFQFTPNQHDNADKTFFGQTGNWDGTDIIRMVVNSAQSPIYMCRRLWSFFAGNPDHPGALPALQAMVARWTATARNVGEVVRTMFTHPAFYTDAAIGARIKQPAEVMAGAFHGLGIAARDGHPEWYDDRLGQELFYPPDVSGWGVDEYWLSTVSAAAQADFGIGLTHQAAFKGTKNLFLQETLELSPADAVTRMFNRLGVYTITSQTRSAIEAFLRDDRIANGWGGGQLGRLLQLVLVSPEYLVN